MTSFCVMTTPLGPLTLAATDDALTGLWFETPPQARRESWTQDDAHLAQIFHQVAPVYEPSTSQNTDFLGANPKAKLDHRGYAGLRGAGAAGLRSSARQCQGALDCAPLAQPRSPLHPRNSRVPDEISGLVLRQAQRELAEYFAGERQTFDVKLQPQGTAFQQAVWAQLLKVGFGETSTYGELARALGKPQAARAVGAAVGANPISIIVPCHRIIGRDGALTGYAWGLERKVALLQLEAQRELSSVSAQRAGATTPAPAVHSSRSAYAPAH